MATRYFRASQGYASVVTTRHIAVATNVAVQVILGSGNAAMTIFNHGTGNVIWGDSGIAVNSGNYIFVTGRVEWSDLQDGWSTYLRADSVSSIVTVTEYAV